MVPRDRIEEVPGLLDRISEGAKESEYEYRGTKPGPEATCLFVAIIAIIVVLALLL